MSLSISNSKKYSVPKPKTKPTTSYLKKYLLLLFLALFCTSGFILIIDPLYIFRIVNIKGFNNQKPFFQEGGMRESKSIDLNSGKYDFVMFGTSRINQGIDPSHPLFPSNVVGNKNIYNAGLNGASFYETYKVFKFASQKNKLQKVIIGLDFQFFTNEHRVIDAFYESKFAGKNIFFANSKDLFSPKMLERSWETLKINLATEDISLTSEKSEKSRFQAIFNRVNLLRIPDDTLAYNPPETMKLLEEIIAECREKNIELYLLISPVHARHQENIRLSDLYPTYEQWKRDLVTLVATNVGDNSPQSSIYLWDFNGYNSVTTETFETNEPQDELIWFKDQTHQTRELGNWVMEVMFSYPERPTYIPDDFGVLLTPENIEAYLQKVREDQAQYHLEYAEEINKIEKLAHQQKNEIKNK